MDEEQADTIAEIQAALETLHKRLIEDPLPAHEVVGALAQELVQALTLVQAVSFTFEERTRTLEQQIRQLEELVQERELVT